MCCLSTFSVSYLDKGKLGFFNHVKSEKKMNIGINKIIQQHIVKKLSNCKRLCFNGYQDQCQIYRGGGLLELKGAKPLKLS